MLSLCIHRHIPHSILFYKALQFWGKQSNSCESLIQKARNWKIEGNFCLSVQNWLLSPSTPEYLPFAFVPLWWQHRSSLKLTVGAAPEVLCCKVTGAVLWPCGDSDQCYKCLGEPVTEVAPWSPAPQCSAPNYTTCFDKTTEVEEPALKAQEWC